MTHLFNSPLNGNAWFTSFSFKGEHLFLFCMHASWTMLKSFIKLINTQIYNPSFLISTALPPIYSWSFYSMTTYFMYLIHVSYSCIYFMFSSLFTMSRIFLWPIHYYLRLSCNPEIFQSFQKFSALFFFFFSCQKSSFHENFCSHHYLVFFFSAILFGITLSPSTSSSASRF